MEIVMTNLQKTNILNMALLSVVILGYAAYVNDPYVLTFLTFPALIAWINSKDF
jgi:hypothetical protein